MHYLLTYELVPDYVARRAPLRADHLRLAWAALGPAAFCCPAPRQYPPDRHQFDRTETSLAAHRRPGIHGSKVECPADGQSVPSAADGDFRGRRRYAAWAGDMNWPKLRMESWCFSALSQKNPAGE